MLEVAREMTANKRMAAWEMMENIDMPDVKGYFESVGSLLSDANPRMKSSAVLFLSLAAESGRDIESALPWMIRKLNATCASTNPIVAMDEQEDARILFDALVSATAEEHGGKVVDYILSISALPGYSVCAPLFELFWNNHKKQGRIMEFLVENLESSIQVKDPEKIVSVLHAFYFARSRESSEAQDRMLYAIHYFMKKHFEDVVPVGNPSREEILEYADIFLPREPAGPDRWLYSCN